MIESVNDMGVVLFPICWTLRNQPKVIFGVTLAQWSEPRIVIPRITVRLRYVTPKIIKLRSTSGEVFILSR